MALLLLLLVLSYIGSLWASSERKRAFGSPSGVEYVVLGALLGPEALGVLDRGTTAAFEPIAIVALGWVGLILGLECGIVDERAAPIQRFGLGLLFTTLTAAATAAAAWWLLGWFELAGGQVRLALSAAVGLVSAETTRHAVRWIGERQPLSGPLSALLLDLAAADDAPVLLGLCLLFAQLSGEHSWFGAPITPAGLAALTIGSGVVLGALSAWLIGRTSSPVEGWTVLLGATWLATGVNDGLGLSALTATFVLGVTLAALSPAASALRARIGETEGAVLLPALLLAGAQLTPPASDAEVALIGGALAVRLATSFAFGFLLSALRPDARGLGLWLGGGMLAPGSLTMIVAFGISLRCSDEVARPALAIAFLGTLLGEVIGPAALKRAFVGSGTPPAPPAAVAPPEPRS